MKIIESHAFPYHSSAENTLFYHHPLGYAKTHVEKRPENKDNNSRYSEQNRRASRSSSDNMPKIVSPEDSCLFFYDSKIGMVNEKMLPLPTPLFKDIVPPCISTSLLVIDRPIPVPG